MKKSKPWVPYAVYESAMARASRDKKVSVIVATTVVSIALIINNIVWQRHFIKLMGRRNG